jgi:multidrug efflux pump subunit AcrB
LCIRSWLAEHRDAIFLLVTKNGILIVEFIKQLRDNGVPFEGAIVDGAAARPLNAT